MTHQSQYNEVNHRELCSLVDQLAATRGINRNKATEMAKQQRPDLKTADRLDINHVMSLIRNARGQAPNAPATDMGQAQPWSEILGKGGKKQEVRATAINAGNDARPWREVLAEIQGRRK
jgi:hypothetical protein